MSEKGGETVKLEYEFSINPEVFDYLFFHQDRTQLDQIIAMIDEKISVTLDGNGFDSSQNGPASAPDLTV